jgi:hypothetical protein
MVGRILALRDNACEAKLAGAGKDGRAVECELRLREREAKKAKTTR